MKNILFVHSSSELYGSDRSLLNIVSNIDKEKYNIYVILPCEGPLLYEMQKLSGVSVEIFEVAVLRRKNLSLKGGIQYIKDFNKSISFIKKIIKKYNIDIVDTNTSVVFPGAVAAKRCGVKSVWHIREIIKNNIENKVISFMMNRYANIIIANSKSTGRALKVDQNKVRVVYNAVEEKQDTGSLLHDGFKVGMAGRINRWKGQKLFVDAAQIVHEKYSDVEFDIAGDVYAGEDEIREELVKYIEDKNLSETVKLLGQVKDMASFYRGIDLFVLPSIQPEPFGLVVIEAMEYGLPVIATNHGGPTEILSEGEDGFLVDFKSANQMAERIIELMVDDNKRKLFGVKGREKKREIFSIKSMVDSVEYIFEEL